MCTRFFFALFFPLSLMAQDVVTILPEYQWVVLKIAPKLEVVSLLHGNEDPHFVDATPAFIFKMAKAKLLIENGLDLEAAWLNKVVEGAGNQAIQQGQAGRCTVGASIKPIQVLKKYDRSMGDVHPVGNPHFTISPKRMLKAVETIYQCLSQVFKLNEEHLKNKQALSSELKELSEKFQKSLSGKAYYVYHREFDYLKTDYGLKVLRSVEKTPGVLPSGGHLMELASLVKKERPSAVLASQTSPKKILLKFKELSKVPFKALPLHPAPKESYIEFFTKNFLGQI